MLITSENGKPTMLTVGRSLALLPLGALVGAVVGLLKLAGALAAAPCAAGSASPGAIALSDPRSLVSAGWLTQSARSSRWTTRSC
jgi:hypothetical protein